jgi:dTDP-4-dehydrorhamnose reductase
MRILITGANGMLGMDLSAVLERAGHQVVRTDMGPSRFLPDTPRWEALNIVDTNAVRQCLLHHQPDVVIHAAAFTDVDGCERDPNKAFQVNAFGTWNVASVCGSHNMTLVYISTDFVFDGEKHEPYTEFDAPRPISHYGASKLAGERYVAQLCRRHFIARTAWLFGVFGRSFPNSILELAKTRPEIPVVSDEIGSPTHTVDLAKTIAELLHTELYGTYHVTNAGHCSRCEMAKAILEIAGVQTTSIHTITSSQYASPTRRPAYSVLRRYALELQGRDNLPPWRQALAEFIELRQKAQSSA